MKKINKSILFIALFTIFVVAGAGRSMAHYQHDKNGWYDEHNHRHDFIMHNGHRGYWDHDSKGVKIFIKV